MARVNRHNPKSLYFSERVTAAMGGIFDYPLAVVEAPMGYGKTTAVREYLNKTAARVLWQVVYDNSLSSFWKAFSGLFARLDANCAQNLLPLGFPTDGVLMQEALRMIEETGLPGKTVLVIDDYHLVETPEVDRFVEFLALNRIANLHIVLIARFTDMQSREELALKGYLHYIAQETFELTPPEIAGYYRLCGINLKEGEADKLYALTGGWISALYLLMLDFVATGRYTPENNIYNLMEKSIYTPFSTEIKDFLLTMSIFNSFTFEQAVHMWEKENTGKILSEVTNKNAFVKYDGRSKIYLVHNIFTEFLKELLAKKDTCCKHALYQKAARWRLKTGDYFAARRCYYECGDFDSILSALEDDRLNFSHEKEDYLQRYMDECPQEVKARHPYAVLRYALYLFAHHETVLFGRACEEFSRILETEKSLNDEAKKRLSGEFQVLLSFTAYNDLPKMSRYHQKAWELLKKPALTVNARGTWTFGSPSVLYLYYRESGRLEEHVRELHEALVCYTRLISGHGSGAGYVMEAERHFSSGDFVDAEISAYKALHHARAKTQTGVIICALFLQIRLAFMKGGFSAIMDILAKMRADIISERQYLFLHTADMCEGYVYALLKQTDRIPKWITVGGINSSRLMFPAFGAFNIVYGRALLAGGEYPKLIGCAEHFIDIASVFPNLLGHVYTHIYLAAANNQIFKEAEALDSLRRALDIALPDKLYMPFVENCDYIKPLLEKLQAAGHYRNGISRILALYADYKKAVERIIRDHFSGPAPGLTGREREIARLAAAGMTNKEIGARLYISENTVKTQLRSVFEKLGVNSRALLKQRGDELQAR